MVKQYVGARYVPKFANPVEWASNTSYEALTIVTFNNASYTSKVPVPPTVGNPANNPQYWALTGNYNAQVEEYRQETLNTKTELNNKITTLDTDKVNKAQINLSSSLNVIVIGDSYAVTSKWTNYARDRLGLVSGTNWHDISLSGISFVNGTILNQLASAQIDDKNTITNIVVCAGANEPKYSSPTNSLDISIAISNFVKYANTNYPNAAIQIGFIGNCRQDSSVLENRTPENMLKALYAYRTCEQIGKNVRYLYGVEYLFHRLNSDFNDDKLHPNETWGSYAGGLIGSAIVTNVAPHTMIDTNFTITSAFEASKTYTGSFWIDNENVTIEIPEIAIDRAITWAGSEYNNIGTFDTIYLNRPIRTTATGFVVINGTVIERSFELVLSGSNILARLGGENKTINPTILDIRQTSIKADTLVIA